MEKCKHESVFSVNNCGIDKTLRIRYFQNNEMGALKGEKNEHLGADSFEKICLNPKY